MQSSLSGSADDRLDQRSSMAPGLEWQVLEQLCFENSIALIQSAGAAINWSVVLHHASQHQVLTLLAARLLSCQSTQHLPDWVQQDLRKAWMLNRYKTDRLRQEVARIIVALKQQDIRFAVTKGLALESTLYGGNGGRSFSDIDFMVLPESRSIVLKTLAQLGYTAGHFNPRTRQIQPHDRQTLIAYRLSPDHLPSHVRLTGDPLLPFIEVDVANSLTWTYSQFQIPVEVALAQVVDQLIPGIAEVTLPTFTPVFQFLFTTLHLFKEAWTELLADSGKAVNLRKFTDVVRLWQRDRALLQTGELRQLLETYDLMLPMLWVLEHLDRNFETGIVPSLGLSGRVSETWLASTGSAKGGVQQWSGTMRDRLYRLGGTFF